MMRPAQASGRWPCGPRSHRTAGGSTDIDPRSEEGHLMPVKPTEQEDEYFARLEFERQRKAFGERVAKDEHRPTRSAGRGRCAKCDAELIPVSYRGIEPGQVLALPRPVAGLRRARSSRDRGHRPVPQHPADLQLTRLVEAGSTTRSNEGIRATWLNARQSTKIRASAIQAHSRARGQ